MDFKPSCKIPADISAGNSFSRIPRTDWSASVVLLRDICSSILDEFKAGGGTDGEKALGSFGQQVKALMPENVFASNPATVGVATLQGQASSALDFLMLAMYLVSNNFSTAASGVSRRVYTWVKRRSNTGLLEYLLSIGGPTIEALAEILFRLAIDADDVHTVKKLMDLGIDPNEPKYRTRWSSSMTPLQRACDIQSLEVARVLIDGGAKIDLPTNGDTDSALMYAVDPLDENLKTKERVPTELVRILLRAGATVNPGFGKSPLALAAKSGYVEVVALLVAGGADVHFSDSRSYSTPIMNAIQCDMNIPDRNVISIVHTLLQAGADARAYADSYSNNVVTVLEAAIPRKSVELIQLLLNSGARVTQSAFVQAAWHGDLDIVKLLFKSGAQVTEEVVESAVDNEGSELVIFLLEATDDNVKSRCKSAALVQAIKYGKEDLIDWLDSSGAQLNGNSKLADAILAAAQRGDMHVFHLLLSENSRYRTGVVESLGPALSAAISHGQNDIVEILLTTSADLNATYKDMTPLLAAIDRRDSNLVRKLLAAGAAVNRISSVGFERDFITTVLPAVVRWGDYTLIRDIIDAGAEINAPVTFGGDTALFVAAEKGELATIELLIEAGADVNNAAATFSGNTVLEAASRNNDIDMVRYLLDLGSDPDEGSLIAAVSGSVELVETLLAARLDRYHRYSKGYGCGALHYAIKLKNATMVEILLANGVDANSIIRRKSGDKRQRWSHHPPPSPPCSPPLPTLDFEESALGCAIRTDKSNDLRIVQMLLRGGADPNSTVTDHRTALLAAIDQNNLALVSALIVAGANANPSTIFGTKRTPLQLAVEKGRTDIIHILLEHGADVNASPYDRYGATALQLAAIGGYVGIAHLLLQKGADVNASPAKVGGRTALEGAAEHGRIDMLQLLLDAGAQIIGFGVEQYERARRFASENGHNSARRLLEKYNAQILENVRWDPTLVDFGFLDDYQL